MPVGGPPDRATLLNDTAESAARVSGRAVTGVAKVELSDSGSGISMEDYYYQRRRGGGSVATPDGGILSMTSDGLAATVVLKVTFGLK